MGGTCCSPENPTNGAVRDTIKRGTIYPESEISQSITESSGERHHRTSDGNIGDNTSKSEYIQMKNAWIEAINIGNDSLAGLYHEQYSDYNLINITFPNGDNAIHVAVKNKKDKLIKFLIDNNCDPNVKNTKTGNTPLIIAVKNKDIFLVTYLFKECKADPNIANNDGETPISLAKKTKYCRDILGVLISNDKSKKLFENNNDNNNINELDDINSKSKNNDDLLDDLDDILEQDFDSKGNNTDYDSDLNLDDHTIKSSKGSNNKLQSLLGDDTYETSDDNKPLSKAETIKLDQIRIQQLNPFTKMKKVPTQRIIETFQDITQKKVELPKLAAWMEKKSPSPPYSWQKRFIMVKDAHLLWNDIERDLINVKNIKERQKFKGSILLMKIRSVSAVYDQKKNRKFIIEARDAKKNQLRKYLWKADSTETRNFWVKYLTKHVKNQKEMTKFLGNQIY